jgi:RimJ/RimL family protein N-acetyltransferase
VLEKLEFVREGCLKQHSRLGGKWCDELVYGRILALPDAGEN